MTGRPPTSDSPGRAVRWAAAADIDELVRLRRVMFESLDMEVTAADDAATASSLAAGLTSGEFFAAVVDGTADVTADGTAAGDRFLAACGIGMFATRVPGPGNPSGRYGYIQSMVTDERARRRGLARIVLAALLDRFMAQGVSKVDLHASAMGEPLYRSEGFRPGRQPELRWVAGDPPPSACEP